VTTYCFGLPETIMEQSRRFEIEYTRHPKNKPVFQEPPSTVDAADASGYSQGPK